MTTPPEPNATIEWYYNSLKGQPRYTDIGKLRSLANKESIQNRINEIIDTIMYQGWTVTGQGTREVFKHFNFELRPFLYDILIIDAGVLVKTFLRTSYKQTKASGYQLKPLSQRRLESLRAVDGGCFLKEVDVNGIVHRYWQYSYKHPHVAPVQFDVAEVAYCSWHPLSYSVYGHSPLEAYRDGFLYRLLWKPDPYPLKPETIVEIKKAVEGTLNRDVMPEFGRGARFKFT
jgi:hypothetical protein